ncbi:STAS domain-containing protein [Nonomuraea turkmeniaca]|uniref:STAS domain-containing protein n=1 Tax=Nonomuraea turkmeniaca TaxID=103838 RepID=A0A5S4G4R5_9ACTN|nr:ATP-binding protein [Nonomuraea turkmeniaca]TMR20950.1 STAS domain-containing protein [Nonomuraea turkmeniaca]
MTRDRPPNSPPPASGGVAGNGSPSTVLEQPFDRNSLYVLRATVEAHAIHAGLPEGRTADLVLAVHELATNVILHGSGSGRVRLRAGDGMLHCQVIDTGATSTEPGIPAWPYEYGHGLWIARSLGDRHSVTRGPDGTAATVGFVLPHPRFPSFQLTRHDQDGRTTLRLIGSLDQGTAPDLTAAVESLIAAGRPRRLVLDLSGMTLWDSIGIATLLAVQEQVNAAPGVSMTLTGVSADFRRRLDSLTFMPLDYENPRD